MHADPDTHEFFVPGRLCLFGEHSDWAAEFGVHRGFCLVIGTDQGLSATAVRSGEFVVRTVVPGGSERAGGRTRSMSCPWAPEALQEVADDADEFFRYCAGVACEMLIRKGLEEGIEIRITAMDLPLKKGVSSSAAVCVLVARAFNELFTLNLFPHELMEMAYLGERRAGSQCGRMDQACVYGATPVLLTFQKSDDVRIEPVFPIEEIYMFFVDLAGKKDTIRILDDLREAYPRARDLQDALGKRNEAIVRAAYQALSAGDAGELGRLMTESQSVFDSMIAHHSPRQLAGPLLHQVLSFDRISGYIHGGKGVGSHGDGTAQFVARGQAERDLAMAEIAGGFPRMQCFPLTIRAAASHRT